jgi:hypothetical protein
MWAFSGHENPTPGDIGVMVVLICLPVVALLPIAGLIQRFRLRPVLAAASLTTERITYAELQQKVRAATPLKQSLNALVASLFAFFAAFSMCKTTSSQGTSSLTPMWRCGVSSRSRSASRPSFGIARFLPRRASSKARADATPMRGAGKRTLKAASGRRGPRSRRTRTPRGARGRSPSAPRAGA